MVLGESFWENVAMAVLPGYDVADVLPAPRTPPGAGLLYCKRTVEGPG